jgi:hypothetical protein
MRIFHLKLKNKTEHFYRNSAFFFLHNAGVPWRIASSEAWNAEKCKFSEAGNRFPKEMMVKATHIFPPIERCLDETHYTRAEEVADKARRCVALPCFTLPLPSVLMLKCLLVKNVSCHCRICGILCSFVKLLKKKCKFQQASNKIIVRNFCKITSKITCILRF